mmetsp:Transcript_83600/g.180365  ORF Transcript_83600/g.180365 Transcript_83600/m.180365 type:complete len:209 (-) Transcript_83600:567-1193(-)
MYGRFMDSRTGDGARTTAPTTLRTSSILGGCAPPWAFFMWSFRVFPRLKVQEQKAQVKMPVFAGGAVRLGAAGGAGRARIGARVVRSFSACLLVSSFGACSSPMSRAPGLSAALRYSASALPPLGKAFGAGAFSVCDFPPRRPPPQPAAAVPTSESKPRALSCRSSCSLFSGFAGPPSAHGRSSARSPERSHSTKTSLRSVWTQRPRQ